MLFLDTYQSEEEESDDGDDDDDNDVNTVDDKTKLSTPAVRNPFALLEDD